MRRLILVVALMAPVAVAAQGLGDAAAREKKKRQSQPAKPPKAITQDQLDAAVVGRDAWNSPDGVFRAGFTGQPEVKEYPAQGGGTTYRLAVGSTAYLVNVRSQPASASADAVVKEVRDGALRTLANSSVMAENDVITPKGIPGRQFLVSFTGRTSERPGVMRSRVYLSGGRSFVVSAVVEAGGENSADVVAFFDSFEILK
jgi:hypothetical protein